MRHKDNKKSVSEKMKKQIAVSKADRQFLMKLFKVTERTVFNALALDKPGNDLHKRIRKAAMNRGGVIMTTIPAGEAIHFHDGTMRMDFDNGAILEFYRNDGTGHLFFKGKEVASYDNVPVRMIFEIKEQAAALK